MKRQVAALLALGLLLSCCRLCAQSCSLKYGKGKNQVSVYNANTDKNFREDIPMGPMSFRIIGSDIWVLDSKGMRLFACSAAGEIKNEAVIASLPANALLEDFAPYFAKNGALSYFWAANASEFAVIKLSPDGKELMRIGSEQQGMFAQIDRLELDAMQRLYVGDIGASTLFVFSPEGALIKKYRYTGGFALDKDDSLHLLDYSPKAGYLHRIYSKNGALTKCVEVGLSKLTNGQAWAVSASGGLFATFIPEGGFKGHIDLIEILPNGAAARKAQIVPVQGMNRFLCVNNSHYSLAEANFAAAPAGSFNIKTTGW